MRTRLTIQELDAFVELADTLSFRAAAERCFVSQPALSRTIASAEAKLGTRLFDRNTRRVELTGSGLELLPVARRVVFELRDTLSDLSEFVAGRRGQFTIASVPGVAAAVLPAPMQAFLQLHPEVSIGLRSVVTSEVLELIANGTAHIGFCALDASSAKQAGVDYRPLLEDELMLVCAANDPVARRRRAAWQVLAQRPLIANGPASGVRPLIEKALAEAGVPFRPRYESGNVSVAAAMVAAGLGVTIIPALARRLVNSEGLAFIPLTDPVVRRGIGIVSREGRSLPAAAALFVQMILTVQRATVDAQRKK